MYLTKKDLDFIIHLHNEFLAKKLSELSVDKYLTSNYIVCLNDCYIAQLMEEQDYIYLMVMIDRLLTDREKINQKQKEYISQKRKTNKNYGRGYAATIKRRDSNAVIQENNF